METLSPFLLSLLGNTAIAALIISSILFLSFFRKLIEKYTKYFIAVTAGVILSVVFLNFIPELSGELKNFSLFILAGVLLFYLLENTLHVHHCHDLDSGNHSCESIHKQEKLMGFGTFLHNLFHGVVLFSAFAVSFQVGIGVTIAIALHSLPQNIANYIMNHKKWFNVILAATGGIFGALLCYPFGDFITENKFVILALTTGGLLYLALSDVIPSINHKSSNKEKFGFFFLVVFGIFINYAVAQFAEKIEGNAKGLDKVQETN